MIYAMCLPQVRNFGLNYSKLLNTFKWLILYIVTQLNCSIITKNIDTIRFFQSFEETDFVFNFYSFDFDSALNSILKHPPSILIVDFDHPMLLQVGWGFLLEAISCLEVSPVMIRWSRVKNLCLLCFKSRVYGLFTFSNERTRNKKMSFKIWENYQKWKN